MDDLSLVCTSHMMVRGTGRESVEHTRCAMNGTVLDQRLSLYKELRDTAVRKRV